MAKANKKTKDLRRSHPGKSGRKLKYGEPTVLIPVFYCPASKEAELKKILRDKLDEYRSAYLAGIKQG